MLGVHARGIDAELAQRRADLLDHVARPADEVLAHRLRAKQRRGKLPHARGVDAAVVQRDLLRFAAHDEMQRQPPEVTVLERQQLLETHGAR